MKGRAAPGGAGSVRHVSSLPFRSIATGCAPVDARGPGGVGQSCRVECAGRGGVRFSRTVGLVRQRGQRTIESLRRTVDEVRRLLRELIERLLEPEVEIDPFHPPFGDN